MIIKAFEDKCQVLHFSRFSAGVRLCLHQVLKNDVTRFIYFIQQAFLEHVVYAGFLRDTMLNIYTVPVGEE